VGNGGALQRPSADYDKIQADILSGAIVVKSGDSNSSSNIDTSVTDTDRSTKDDDIETVVMNNSTFDVANQTSIKSSDINENNAT
jgi:hypothetical protein